MCNSPYGSFSLLKGSSYSGDLHGISHGYCSMLLATAELNIHLPRVLCTSHCAQATVHPKHAQCLASSSSSHLRRVPARAGKIGLRTVCSKLESPTVMPLVNRHPSRTSFTTQTSMNNYVAQEDSKTAFH